jgi:hypothetical protein
MSFRTASKWSRCGLFARTTTSGSTYSFHDTTLYRPADCRGFTIYFTVFVPFSIPQHIFPSSLNFLPAVIPFFPLLKSVTPRPPGCGAENTARRVTSQQLNSSPSEPYLLSLTPRPSRPALHELYLVSTLFLLVLGTLPSQRPLFAAVPKVHTVTLGPFRKVPYTQPDATPDTRTDETSTLKVRPLFVDDHQKEWTTGEIHDITDRTFTVRRALRLNDSLPTDAAPHWIWQPGPWLSVDRVTGHITALHLPDFDAAVSDVVWFRDYAAYCGIATTAKGGLFAIVAQLGARRPVVQKQIGTWPQSNHFIPVCQPAQWQRLPMRVTLKPTGGEATTYDVVGTASLIEEGDNSDEN